MTEGASGAEATMLPPAQALDTGLGSLVLVAGYYRIAADSAQLRHQLALTGRPANAEDIVRGANVLKLKSRILSGATAKRLAAIPYPAILGLKERGFAVLGAGSSKGRVRLIDPIARSAQDLAIEAARALSSGEVVLITRRLGGAGVDPNTFGFRWFLPSILRYRKPLGQVVVASLFVQLFALATPIFFQLVVDKVLVHKGLSTLVVLIVGMVTLGLFETILQFLRTYTLSHTTNRMDVELGRRLFHHLFRLPLSYFETRAAGQTVARMRELETIRSFLTGQGLTSSPVWPERSSTWPPGQEIPLYRQFADLAVEFGGLPLAPLLAIAHGARPPREQARHIVHDQLLPAVNLVRMHAMPLGQLRNRHILPQRLQRDLRLERRIELLA
jgi:ATP-binding cassette, subfamily B, bacterial HlyB/CyaB